MVYTHYSLVSLALVSLAYATPRPTDWRPAQSGAPWYLQVFSERVVDEAARIRFPNVPATEASAVAHTLVESGLAHPQYTSLAQEALDMWVNDGPWFNATSLYRVATNAKSAYDEIHTQAAYSSYIEYARAHASLFDLASLQPSPPPHLTGASAEAARENRAFLTSVYSSLVADPSGKAAVSTLNSVADGYIRDFTRNSSAKASVSVVENLLTYLVN